MRRLFALSLILVAAGTGCRICASPYDYCGPVVDDCCCGSDYQPQTPYRGQSAPMVSEGEMESSEPVYYESNKPTTTKTATKSSTPRRSIPATDLPRQAKRPKGILTY